MNAVFVATAIRDQYEKATDAQIAAQSVDGWIRANTARTELIKLARQLSKGSTDPQAFMLACGIPAHHAARFAAR